MCAVCLGERAECRHVCVPLCVAVRVRVCVSTAPPQGYRVCAVGAPRAPYGRTEPAGARTPASGPA